MQTRLWTGLWMGALLAMPASAETATAKIKVDNAWVRATAPGQQVAGAFMDITAAADMTLVAAESPAAKVTELHTMAMDKGVMIMRQVPSIGLPKGKTISLKPGGLHVMLIDLNAQLKEGDKAPIGLTVRDADGKSSKLVVEAEVRRSEKRAEEHGHHHH